MNKFNKHKEIAAILSQRGVKRLIHKKTGISLKTLYNIQTGKAKTKPNEGTLRLIASALGLPGNSFLQSQMNSKSPPTRRLIVEIDLPEDSDFTEVQLRQLRKAMVDSGRHIINIIKELKGDT